jgi:predicted site-specific integrase-resolvase
MGGYDPEEMLKPGAALALVPMLSRRTLQRYASAGHLPATVLPSGHRRYRRRDVLALIGKGSTV